LVVMDIGAFTRRESMLKLRENLVAVEEERLNGKQGASIDEVVSMMEMAVRETIEGNEDRRYLISISDKASEMFVSHARFLAEPTRL
jgi:hypothetical protein